MRPLVLSLLSIFLLTGCEKLLDPFGANKEPRLPGKRLAVLSSQSNLQVDDGLQKFSYNFPNAQTQLVWPQQYGNSQHLLANLQWSGTWQLAWSLDIGSGFSSNTPLQATPIIAGNQVFTLDNDYTVTALQLSDGQQVWQTGDATEVSYSLGYGGGLALHAGKLIITTGYGDIFALNPLDGSQIWRKSLRLPIRSAPTTVGDIVIVQTIDSQAFAFSLADGGERWFHTGVNEITSVINQTSPTADAQRAFIAYNSGEIAALSSVDGTPVWLDSLTSIRRTSGLARINTIGASPVLFDKYLLVSGYSDQTVLFNTETGRRIWEIPLGTLSIPIISGSAIFLLASDHRLYSLDLASGKVRWITEPNIALSQFIQQQEPSEEGSETELLADDISTYRFHAPIMVNNKLMSLSTEGILLEFDPIDGNILSHRELKNGSITPIQVVNDTLLVLSPDGVLSAYR